MHRFFTDNTIDEEGYLEITGSDVKHIRDVLRMNEGEEVEAVHEGKAYLCSLHKLEKNSVTFKTIEPVEKSHESPVEIFLFQGLPKSTKMETILQKCTEIGVNGFYPLVTARTGGKISEEKEEEKKLERWQSIVNEAAKQSKRDRIPMVYPVIKIGHIRDILSEGITVVPYEQSECKGIKDVLRTMDKPNRINIVIGPEGGFEKEEVEMLEEMGAYIVSLGPRILRTETAGRATAAVVQYEFGDLGVIE